MIIKIDQGQECSAGRRSKSLDSALRALIVDRKFRKKVHA